MSQYNERFLFSDPFNINAVNRTTRYRLKRRQRSKCHSFERPKMSPVHSARVCGDNVGNEVCCSSVSLDSNESLQTSVSVTLDEQPIVVERCNKDEENGGGGNDYHDADCDTMNHLHLELVDDEPDTVASSSSDDDLEPNPEPNSLEVSQQLYEGSQLSVQQSSILIKKFTTRHNVSNEGLQDLLHLIKLHCPLPNKFSTSTYLFNQQFGKISVEFLYFCGNCLESINIDTKICTNIACGKEVRIDGRLSSFIEVPISLQLERLLGRTCKFLLMC